MSGRKRNADPNLYSTRELALAVNIAPRNVILLCEREDLPIVSGGGGAPIGVSGGGSVQVGGSVDGIRLYFSSGNIAVGSYVTPMVLY